MSELTLSPGEVLRVKIRDTSLEYVIDYNSKGDGFVTLDARGVRVDSTGHDVRFNWRLASNKIDLGVLG